jgi:hypothetical protein
MPLLAGGSFLSTPDICDRLTRLSPDLVLGRRPFSWQFLWHRTQPKELEQLLEHRYLFLLLCFSL